MKDEIVAASAKAAPPVAVSSSQYIFDLTLNEWVSIGTLIYLALQVYVLVRNEMRKRQK